MIAFIPIYTYLFYSIILRKLNSVLKQTFKWQKKDRLSSSDKKVSETLSQRASQMWKCIFPTMQEAWVGG
jgi:hypothetical protein